MSSKTEETRPTCSAPAVATAKASVYEECASSDADLFSFMSNMHLHNNASGLSTNRKRKLGLDTGAGASKTAPPTDNGEVALHTPLCSASGFADDEDRRLDLHQLLSDHVLKQKLPLGLIHGFGQDLDEHLASNFDDSLTGLGNVDPVVASLVSSTSQVANSSAVMSEALLALPNLSISNGGSVPHHLPLRCADVAREELLKSSNGKSSQESNGRGSIHAVQNFGALDLSNDDAHLPDQDEKNGVEVDADESYDKDATRGTIKSLSPSNRKSFIGSLASSNSNGALKSSPNHNAQLREDRLSIEAHKSEDKTLTKGKKKGNVVTSTTTTSATNAKTNSEEGGLPRKRSETSLVDNKPLLQSDSCPYYEHVSEEEQRDHFQYVLAAPTSIATKLLDPSITYLNQGQSYELRMKKLGDLSSYRERVLKSVMRICFQDKRLQYMEAEQIKDWQTSHPGERILEIDVPLSYGLIEPIQSPLQPNVLTFKWDPTRETGVFIRVNCISTEFTPKKHGGEKGVPFRLQLETFDPETEERLHAGGCILQVFKLKGAERKHKQDRDKISKRPALEQEKYAPGYDSTVFTDLPVEAIYVPQNATGGSEGKKQNSHSSVLKEEQQNSRSSVTKEVTDSNDQSQGNILDNASNDTCLSTLATPASISASSGVEVVQKWLKDNRYGHLLETFERYDGRDLLRLSREDVITLCNHSLADGIRLYNDLHLTAVAATTTFYVTASPKNDEHEFYALFLEDLTLNAFVKEFSGVFGVDNAFFSKVLLIGPGSILIRVTDAVIRNTVTESIFMFTLRQHESTNASNLPTFDIILERLNAATNEAATTTVEEEHTERKVNEAVGKESSQNQES